jgi:aspartyl/glutamyl-tRNA(Asn/Gln) amidotransferase C subunit
MSDITSSTVHHIAALANIPVSPDEEQKLAEGFTTTMDVVDQLKIADTSNTQPLHQVTGLLNVLREDEVDESRMFTQEQACMNAKQSHNGFIVVPQILDQE